jgi:hypothetical protein
MKEKESDIQNSICEYLALRKHFFRRQNTAPTIQKSESGWSFRRVPKYAMRGVADIMVVHTGRPYFLDVKRPGRNSRPIRKSFRSGPNQPGAVCCCPSN